MSIYDPIEANSVRKKMDEFLVNGIEIANNKLAVELAKSGKKVKITFSRRRTSYDIGDEDYKNPAVSDALNIIYGYTQVGMFLKRVHVSPDLAQKLSDEILSMGRKVTTLNYTRVTEIHGAIPVNVKEVCSETENGRLESRRTAWLQLKGIVFLYAEFAEAKVKDFKSKNPDIEPLKYDFSTIREMLDDNIKALGRPRELVPNQDYEVLAP